MLPHPTDRACKKKNPKLTHSTEFRFAIFDFFSNRVNRSVRTEAFELERGIEAGHGFLKPNRESHMRTVAGRNGSSRVVGSRRGS